MHPIEAYLADIRDTHSTGATLRWAFLNLGHTQVK